MPAYYKITSARYFRTGTIVCIALALGLLLFITVVMPGIDGLKAREREDDATLRKLGCVPEVVHTYHSVVLGEAPGSIWRCGGKLVYGQLANLLVNADKNGDPTYWRKLQAEK